jgi:hypothetical protein
MDSLVVFVYTWLALSIITLFVLLVLYLKSTPKLQLPPTPLLAVSSKGTVLRNSPIFFVNLLFYSVKIDK